MKQLVYVLTDNRVVQRRRTMSQGWAVCALFLALTSGCKAKESNYEAPPLPAVTAMTTEFGDPPALIRKGTVAAGAQFRLGFQVPGVVASVCCRTGDKVRQGQTLATLRAGDADARLRAANASRAMAERDEATTAHLVDGGALAPNLAKHARDQLAIAQAQATLADEALRYTRLQSPVAGTVQARYAEPGEAIAPGMPVLLVEQMGKLVVRVGILQEELARVIPGNAVELEPERALRDESPSANSSENHGKPLTGVISSVAPVPEPTDGLFTVEISPRAELGVKLVPGAIVSVRFKPGASAAAATVRASEARSVRIPNDAVVNRHGVEGVLVLQGSGTDTIAKFRTITIGKRLGKDVWVMQGLTSGERIIAEGAYFIEDGERVRVLSKDAGPHG